MTSEFFHLSWTRWLPLEVLTRMNKRTFVFAALSLGATATLGIAPTQGSTPTLVYTSDQSVVSIYDAHLRSVAQMRGKHLHPWNLAIGSSGLVYSVNIGSYHEGPPPPLIGVFPQKRGIVEARALIRCPFKQVWAAAVDAQGNLYVTDPTSNAVFTYSPNADGCAPPKSVLQGPHTQLGVATGIAIDSQGRIIVSGGPQGGIAVFAPGASGDAAPIARIFGSLSGLSEPESVAVDAHDNIYAANYSNGTITEYAAGSNGNVAPIRTIEGSATGLRSPLSLAVSKKTGDVYIANYPSHGLLVFDAKANGNVAPKASLPGSIVAVAVSD
jgi:DNA-binding beta-propeller fold protein YncE